MSESETNKNKTFSEILILQCYGGEDTFTVKECKRAIIIWLEQMLREQQKGFNNAPDDKIIRSFIAGKISEINSLVTDLELG